MPTVGDHDLGAVHCDRASTAHGRQQLPSVRAQPAKDIAGCVLVLAIWARDEQIAAIAGEPRTVILYESPNRVAATLALLAERCGSDRRAVVARELTKLHEELRRGTLAELAEWAAGGVKGEVVVVIEGAADSTEVDDAQLLERLAEALAAGASRRDAVDAVVAETGAKKRRVYDLALDV